MATTEGSNGGPPTLGEVRRRVERLEGDFDKNVVPKALYTERQRYLDNELRDLEKWQEQHQEGHKWLARLLAGTALTMLVTLVVILIQVIGRGQGAG